MKEGEKMDYKRTIEKAINDLREKQQANEVSIIYKVYLTLYLIIHPSL
jgi:hypothetical protein